MGTVFLPPPKFVCLPLHDTQLQHAFNMLVFLGLHKKSQPESQSKGMQPQSKLQLHHATAAQTVIFLSVGCIWHLVCGVSACSKLEACGAALSGVATVKARAWPDGVLEDRTG